MFELDLPAVLAREVALAQPWPATSRWSATLPWW
jgi:hypothetical protein